jgi:hypothetical protein
MSFSLQKLIDMGAVDSGVIMIYNMLPDSPAVRKCVAKWNWSYRGGEWCERGPMIGEAHFLED